MGMQQQPRLLPFDPPESKENNNSSFIHKPNQDHSDN
jgi:hypothetical protein